MKTTTVETNRISGAALDWAVAKAVGLSVTEDCGQFMVEDGTIYLGRVGHEYSPSTDWSQGGPLIEKLEGLAQDDAGNWYAIPKTEYYVIELLGTTLLIAICRAIVAEELGDDMEVPAELVEVRDA